MSRDDVLDAAMTRTAPGHSTPTLRPRSGRRTLESLALLGAFLALGWLVAGRTWGVVMGAAAFLAHRLVVVRGWLCRDQARGVAAMSRGEIEEALEHFRRSEARWRRRRWLDRHRGLLLGSAGPYGFLSLARYNQAHCLARLERGDEALAILDDLLSVEPDHALAAHLRELITA